MYVCLVSIYCFYVLGSVYVGTYLWATLMYGNVARESNIQFPITSFRYTILCVSE